MLASWFEDRVSVWQMGLFHVIIFVFCKRFKNNGPSHLKTLASSQTLDVYQYLGLGLQPHSFIFSSVIHCRRKEATDLSHATHDLVLAVFSVFAAPSQAAHGRVKYGKCGIEKSYHILPLYKSFSKEKIYFSVVMT